MSFTSNRLPPSALIAIVIALLPLATMGALKTRLLQYVSSPVQATAPVVVPVAAPAPSRAPAPKLAAATETAVGR